MILGITGISGAGKHTAARFFEKKGWVVLDADEIAHHLYRPYNYAWKAIVKRFGDGILTKEDLIDRQKLRAIVFNAENTATAKKALEDLNAILHPELKRQMEEKIHRYFRRKSNLVVVAALWDKLDLFELCDKVLLIEAHGELASTRIKKRDGISQANYQAYIKTQIKPSHPHFTLGNNGTLREFEKHLIKLMKHLGSIHETIDNMEPPLSKKLQKGSF